MFTSEAEIREAIIEIARASAREQMGEDADQAEITGSTNLVGSGLFDSMGFMNLLIKVESRFNVEVDLDDREPSEFTTVEGLAERSPEVSVAAIEAAAVRIVQLARGDTGLLKQVESQFGDLHRVLEGYGLVTPLIPGGERIWLEGLEPMLGRMVGLTAAVHQDEQVLGFIHTTLVRLPDYLGGARAARLGHIYVADRGRNLGLATRMWDVAEEWLRSRGVTSVEVQAQVANIASRSLWPRLGFAEEVLQFRKVLKVTG